MSFKQDEFGEFLPAVQKAEIEARRQKATILSLELELAAARAQLAYQNAEILRLIQRYERDTLPPGLRFMTGIDIKSWTEANPGPSLIQGAVTL
jgi:hypothetical protein